MPLEWRTSVFAQYVVDAIKAANDSDPVVFSTPLVGVYYGDQNSVGSTPILCVEPNDRDRTLNGVPRKTQLEISLFLILYVDKVQSPQRNRLESDQLSEEVEAFLHEDPTMGGQAIHSMVTRVESGASNKNNSLIRASRLTLQITTQQMLPLA